MSERNWKALAQKAYDLGFDYEKRYGGCTQCVIAALQDTLDLRNGETDAIFKSATGLAGGVGGEGDGHCGAYSGAVLLMGYIVGRERDNFADPERIRDQTGDLAAKLHGKFIDEYGTVTCRSIHTKIFGRPFYLRDPDEKEKFMAAGAHEDKCTSIVGNAARWVVETLHEAGRLQETL